MLTYSTSIIISGMFAEVLTVFKTISVVILVFLTDDYRFFSLLRAFFWLVSLLLSSLVWFISVQISNKESASQQKGLLIFGVVLSVVLQETFRFGYYKLLK